MKSSHCLNESVPPLLRGIGTTIILLATALSAATARRDGRPAPGILMPSAKPPVASPSSVAPDLARELLEIRRELAQESTLEEIIENPWFEGCGYAGTGCIAASFFVEWTLRRRKLAGDATRTT